MKCFSFVLLFLFVCGAPNEEEKEEKEEEEEDVKCAERNYGQGGTVCVCNSSYCDTVEPLGSLLDDEYVLYLSSQEGLRFHKTKYKFENPQEENAIKISVNAEVKYQKINGFGGALTDSASLNIHNLSPDARLKVLESYFSPKGIEYNLIRVPIGGTDFSTRKYTLDDIPGDPQLEYFKLTTEDIELRIPLILQSQKLSKREIKIIGSAWTAPPWMKTNNDYTCFGLLKSRYYDVWADYYLKFLDEYDKKGVKLWALTTGNEPVAGLLPYYSFNCMGWTPFSQSRWLAQNLGPKLKCSKFNETVIIGVDDNRYTLPWWPKIMFTNVKTKELVSGIGVHWYWDNYFPPRLLDWTHSAFPDKFLLYTEACYVRERGKPAVVLGSWSRGEGYASNIISNLNHYVSGWVDWNVALDVKGGPTWVNNVVDSPIIVNATVDEFYKQPMFYAIGHFSKFVPPASVRIYAKHSSYTNLNYVAFLTPENNIVVVMLNRKKSGVRINIYGSSKGVSSFVLPKKSIATLIYKNIT